MTKSVAALTLTFQFDTTEIALYICFSVPRQILDSSVHKYDEKRQICVSLRSALLEMNAIIALCHFCEAHGPCPIFCTQTLRDLRIDELVCRLDATDNGCPGCISIGNSMGIVSQDVESDANFLSTQTTVLSDIAPLIKQAAVRSLSCEVIFIRMH